MVVFKNIVRGALIASIALMSGGVSLKSAHAGDIVPYDRQLILSKASTPEEVGVAFLKTTNNFPDFRKVVRESDTYRKLDPLAQGDYEVKEVAKLQNAFLAYSPKKSSLMIRLGVKVEYQQTENGGATLKFYPESHGPLYFPYYFAGYSIALIPNGIDLFQEQTLTREEGQVVYGTLGLDGAATLLLQLYPVAGDDKTPVVMDNIPQYPLLAEIGYIGLINARAEQIWAWKSPKFDRKGVQLNGGTSAPPLIDLVPKIRPQ